MEAANHVEKMRNIIQDIRNSYAGLDTHYRLWDASKSVTNGKNNQERPAFANQTAT